MRMIAIIFYLALVIIGISFAALNATTVAVNFYFLTLTIPVSVLAVMMLAIGVGIGFVLFLFKYWRLKILHVKTKNQLKMTEKEIQNLRTIPIRNQDSAF